MAISIRISSLDVLPTLKASDFLPIVQSGSAALLTTYRTPISSINDFMSKSGAVLSASFASASLSASHARLSDSASYLYPTFVYNATVSASVTSSFSLQARSASFASTTPSASYAKLSDSASYLYPHILYQTTASWAQNALNNSNPSASWASQSLSSSFALTAISSAFASQATSASFASTATSSSFALTASYIASSSHFLGNVLTSADATLVNNTLIIPSTSHGLGGTPRIIQVFMVNKAANAAHGYAVGDIVPVEVFTQDNNDGTTHPGFLLTARANATTYALSCQVNTGAGWRLTTKAGTGTIFTSVAQVILDWNARVVLVA